MKPRVNSLVRKAKSGDRQAFGQLVVLYQDKMLYLGYDLMGNWDDAKDAAQETFIKAMEKLPTFQEKAHFSTWLYRIMVNKCRDMQRKHSRAPLDTVEEEMLERVAHQNSDEIIASKYLESLELKKSLEKALQQLSTNQRTAVVLKYFHEYSTKETAEIMGCSDNTVRIHVFRAFQKLRIIIPKQSDV